MFNHTIYTIHAAFLFRFHYPSESFAGVKRLASAGSGLKQSQALKSQRSSRSPGREQRTFGDWVYRKRRTTPGQHAELYLPVTVTQSYNSLIPNLGVLVNSLTFFININRLCLKDKSFQRLSNRKRYSEQKLMRRNEPVSKTLIILHTYYDSVHH